MLLLFISASDTDFTALTNEMTARLCPGGGRVRVFGVADAGAEHLTQGSYAAKYTQRGADIIGQGHYVFLNGEGNTLAVSRAPANLRNRFRRTFANL